MSALGGSKPYPEAVRRARDLGQLCTTILTIGGRELPCDRRSGHDECRIGAERWHRSQFLSPEGHWVYVEWSVDK